MEYIWEIGQTTTIVPNGMTERVKGTITNIRESRSGDTKFLYVEYIDPRDGTMYGGWFDDQTDRPVHAAEMRQV